MTQSNSTPPSERGPETNAGARKLIIINSLAVVVLAGILFVYPAARSFLDLRDPALSQPGIPKAAWRLYRNLTPQYAHWADQRMSRGRAETLSTRDISGTEWPLFGSVFYLWGIENLQKVWEAGEHRNQPEPRIFARDAIVAASELVIDPKHASWVKKHWGNDYPHRENVFYRMLVIAALTSRETLLHDTAHLDILRDQVDTLASELDASRTGLLDDYPGECYPGDVMAAIMCIKRADAVLGTDHSGFVTRALRGFTRANATRHGLPPYSASSGTGAPISPARGCANSYLCLTSPELWPTQAKEWYGLHEQFFWQRRITALGFREFPIDHGREYKKPDHSHRLSIGAPGYQETPDNVEWALDVDAGPVIAGHGVSASAFGMGAARKNGRFDHAYPLSVELLATAWELPGGVLALPRLLSNASDAPFLGEAAILWLLTIQPEPGFPLRLGSVIPPFVYIVTGTMLLIAMALTLQSLRRIQQARHDPLPAVWAPRFQIGAWICLVSSSAVMFVFGYGLIGLALILPALLLPRVKLQRPHK